jgi:hypothetical protein
MAPHARRAPRVDRPRSGHLPPAVPPHVALTPSAALLGAAGLKASTGLSQAAIAGGSLASILLSLPQRHPWDPSRWLIDLDLALILTPALLLGVSVGEWAGGGGRAAARAGGRGGPTRAPRQDSPACGHVDAGGRAWAAGQPRQLVTLCEEVVQLAATQGHTGGNTAWLPPAAQVRC